MNKIAYTKEFLGQGVEEEFTTGQVITYAIGVAMIFVGSGALALILW